MIEDHSRKTTAGVSASSISSEHLGVLLREATTAARRLVRKLGLPTHEHEDLRQELLVDLIARFKWFDPARGTLSVFAGVIVRHRAKRLTNHVNRERTIFAPISPGDAPEDPNGTASGDTIDEADGYTAARSLDGFAAIDRRLDLTRALSVLRPGELSLCTKLIERTPTEISRAGEFSRAVIYRRLRGIRLRLLQEGVSWP
jgi:DNA-directed RNA polymerase specialized sigma24 family protein